MTAMRSLKLVLGCALFAVAIYALLAAPGLLTDAASTVPVQTHQRVAAVRR